MEERNQLKNYLQSNFLGIGFQELHNHVIGKGNCVFCGACASLCPRIGMNEKEPTLLEYDPECSTCFRFCPRTYFPEEVFERELFHENVKKRYPLGYYQKIIAAQSTNQAILRVAQNGGVVSSLLIHALDTGLIDGVLLTDRDDNWFPKPVIVRTPEEVLSCTGSKYTIASTISSYNDAINKFKLKKLAFVGMPCQIHAVRKLQLFSPLSKEYGKFTLIIGLYCYSNYSYDLMKNFIQGELGVSLRSVKKMDASHKKFYIYLNDTSIKEVLLKKIKKYTWESCQYCKDYSAEIADISVGSVGTFKNDWNSVLLRTDIGTKIFNEMVKTKKIVTSNEIDVSKIERESLRKKTRVTQVDGKILKSMQFLNVSEDEIKTYTTLLSLGNASESILSKVMKTEEEIVRDALKKLHQRDWISGTNGTYSSVNPTKVINKEIFKLRKGFLEKIDKLKTVVLPNLQTIYVQNNHIQTDENLE
jgi:coenzyme F420 hydrogenase subunit beta